MRNINELIGIINGISYDGIINKLEVARLSSWVKKKPSKTICEKIDQILEDGIVTQEEQKSLLEMLKKRLNDAQIETKIGYLKNCVKERKNLGIDLIDLLDNADAIDIIHSRAESQLGSTLNSYSGTYVRDPEIVFVSLVLLVYIFKK